MKKLNFILTVITLIFSSITNGQIRQACNGYVKLGGTAAPTHPLDITGPVIIRGGQNYSGPSFELVLDHTGNYGTYAFHPQVDNNSQIGTSNKAFMVVWAYNLVNLSDSTYKENIRKIDNALDKVTRLNGIRYNLKASKYADIEPERLKKDMLGFIAQDVQPVIPEAVIYDDSTQIYGIDCAKIIPVVVEAIKEQQLIIEGLQSEIQQLKKNLSINNLKSASISESSNLIQKDNESLLFQNTPNPFTQNTTIEYFLSANVQEAMICIYNMNGTQLRCIALQPDGNGNIAINGNELKAGMYIYSLIADGQLIDTKQMVLTD